MQIGATPYQRLVRAVMLTTKASRHKAPVGKCKRRTIEGMAAIGGGWPMSNDKCPMKNYGLYTINRSFTLFCHSQSFDQSIIHSSMASPESRSAPAGRSFCAACRAKWQMANGKSSISPVCVPPARAPPARPPTPPALAPAPARSREVAGLPGTPRRPK